MDERTVPRLDKLTGSLKTALSAAGAHKLALAVGCGVYPYAAECEDRNLRNVSWPRPIKVASCRRGRLRP